MANIFLILGEPGVGKSSSAITLDPKSTFLISVADNPLPYKGFTKDYTPLSSTGGNYFSSDIAHRIIRVLEGINTKMPHIKNIVIDDIHYVMCNEFMRRCTEKDYQKFTEIGSKMFEIIDKAAALRSDLSVFFLWHSDLKKTGKVRCKTLGRILDEQAVFEGRFKVILHALNIDGNRVFLTNDKNEYLAKSPPEMFESLYIDNDLLLVKNSYKEYYPTPIEEKEEKVENEI